MSEIPSLVYTPGNKSSAQGKPDILVQNSKPTDPKLILKNTPSTVDIVDEKNLTRQSLVPCSCRKKVKDLNDSFKCRNNSSSSGRI